MGTTGGIARRDPAALGVAEVALACGQAVDN
jgi:hypothetical protein